MRPNSPTEDTAGLPSATPIDMPEVFDSAQPNSSASSTASTPPTRTAGLGQGVAVRRPAVSSVAELGRKLFTDYMFAFEVTSILIIIAMVGAVVLARKRES